LYENWLYKRFSTLKITDLAMVENSGAASGKFTGISKPA